MPPADRVWDWGRELNRHHHWSFGKASKHQNNSKRSGKIITLKPSAALHHTAMYKHHTTSQPKKKAKKKPPKQKNPAQLRLFLLNCMFSNPNHSMFLLLFKLAHVFTVATKPSCTYIIFCFPWGCAVSTWTACVSYNKNLECKFHLKSIKMPAGSFTTGQNNFPVELQRSPYCSLFWNESWAHIYNLGYTAYVPGSFSACFTSTIKFSL